MKIMIFGTEGKDRLSLERALARLGHEVFADHETAGALARIAEADIRLVIADGRLPKFEWLDLCRRLRADGERPYVYFILRSDPETDDSHEAWAAESGVDDFIFKAADERELWRRLRPARRIVDASRRMRHLETALSICSYCKRVRDEQDRWQEIDGFIGTRLRGQLTPVVCPDCYIRNFGPEYRVARVADESRAQANANSAAT